MKNKLYLFIFILLSLSFKEAHSEKIMITDAQSGKLIYTIEDGYLRDGTTNELLWEYKEKSFIDHKTGALLYRLDKKVLIDAASGKQIIEYKNDEIVDANTRKSLYEIWNKEKVIVESSFEKRLFGYNKRYDLSPEECYLILIAAGLVEGTNINVTSSENACDIITKKNGDEIKANILAINKTEITYKSINDPNGPTLSVLVSDVYMINYANGTKDVFK